MTAATLPRRRWWRIVLVALGVLAMLLVAGYVALLRAFPPQRLAALLSDEIRSATGRDFRIVGALSFRLWPTIAVVAEDVTLGNAAWGTRREMATVKRAAFEVAVSPLLDGQLHVLSVEVDGADVLLETDRQGRANWVFTEGKAATAGQPPQADASRAEPAVHIDKLVLSDARIAFRSGLTQATRAVAIESLQIAMQGEQILVAARMAGAHRAWRLDGKTGRYDTLLHGQADWPFDVRVQADDSRLEARGSLDARGTLRATVTARIDNAAALRPFFAHADALPMPIDASARIQRSANALSADAVRLSLAGQTIVGKASLRTASGEPRLELDVAAESIDLSRWGIATIHPTSAPAVPAAKAPFFSDTPLPAIRLPDLPLRAHVRIERLAVPGFPPLAALDAQIATMPESLLVDPWSLAVAGGRGAGRLELGTRDGQPWRVRLRADATGLSLQALDVSTGGERIRGRGDLQLNLEASGRTPHELAASASGHALLAVHDAAVRGTAAMMERNILVTLLQALLPRQPAQSDALQIQCAVVNLPLKNGVAAIDRSIAMETDKLAVAASGELNLAAQTVTLGFHPVAKKGLGLDPASLASLVRLEGPLHDPKIGVDVAGTAREAANIGAAVATAGLTWVGKRLLIGPEETQACQRALGAARP